jgi:transposase-like protein
MGLTRETFLPDEAESAAAWRAARWPQGVYCVACGSDAVECRTTTYRGHLHRYHCQECGKWFSDVTNTPLAYSKVSMSRWVYLIRELDKGRPVLPLADEMGVTYKTALGMAHVVREVLYEHREQWQPLLEEEVEGDDKHLKGGQQGREVKQREARQRGLKARGRGTYASDRPLVCAWVARAGTATVLELCRDAGQHSLLASAWRHIARGARVDTDSWRGYTLLDEAYDHRSVKHSEEYVTAEGTHCNTAEAEWSVFKPWWQCFRGVAKRYIYLYLTQYEFQRTYRDCSFLERLEMVLGFLAASLQHVFNPQTSLASPLPLG